MSQFRKSIPSEFSDEDKYFRFFTKPDLAVIALTGAFTVLLFKLTELFFGKPFIGLIIGVLIMGASLFCSMMRVPESLNFTGGGQKIATILIRRIIRRTSKKIYVKGYDDWEED